MIQDGLVIMAPIKVVFTAVLATLEEISEGGDQDRIVEA